MRKGRSYIQSENLAASASTGTGQQKRIRSQRARQVIIQLLMQKTKGTEELPAQPERITYIKGLMG